jgi:hypothetical protein
MNKFERGDGSQGRSRGGDIECTSYRARQEKDGNRRKHRVTLRRDLGHCADSSTILPPAEMRPRRHPLTMRFGIGAATVLPE